MKSFLTLMCCALAFSSLAQIRTWQLSLTDSSKNILYIGAFNKIRIEGLPAGAVVKCTRAVVRNEGAGIIEVKCRSGLEGQDTFSIIKSGRTIYSKDFLTKRIGDPIVRLGNIKNGFASVAAVLAYPVLKAGIDSSYLDLKFKVISFDISFQSRIADLFAIHCNGDRIISDAAEIISRLKPGDKITFTNIRAVFPGSTIRAMNDVVVTIR